MAGDPSLTSPRPQVGNAPLPRNPARTLLAPTAMPPCPASFHWNGTVVVAQHPAESSCGRSTVAMLSPNTVESFGPGHWCNCVLTRLTLPSGAVSGGASFRSRRLLWPATCKIWESNPAYGMHVLGNILLPGRPLRSPFGLFVSLHRVADWRCRQPRGS